MLDQGGTYNRDPPLPPREQISSLLLSSFACAICPHRPVLDTLAMLTAHRAGKKHLSSKFEGRQGLEKKSSRSLQITVASLFLILSPVSSGLQLFYGKKQPGKGTEQNPRQQNELRRSETKAEVIRVGRVCSQWVCLKGFNFFLALKTLTLSPLSIPGSSVNSDPTYHPKCSAQSSSL